MIRRSAASNMRRFAPGALVTALCASASPVAAQEHRSRGPHGASHAHDDARHAPHDRHHAGERETHIK